MEFLFIALLIATLVFAIPAVVKAQVWPKVVFALICAATFKLGMAQFFTNGF